MFSSLNDNIKVDFGTQYGITIAIHNKHRSGKTLTAIMFVIYYLLHRDDIKGVISNVDLELKYINTNKKFIPLKDIKMIKRDEYKNYILVTDEFRRLCDSRMSSSFKNLFISNILADTGKFKQVHILTDQDGAGVDRRIRLNADAVLYPEIDKAKKICNVKVFEDYNQFFWTLNNGWMNKWEVEFEYDCEPYYKYYNTEQKIEDYIITFQPEDYYKMFMDWLENKTKYMNNPNFEMCRDMITLWKETEGIPISGSQMSALIIWMKYNTEFDLKTRKKKKKDE